MLPGERAEDWQAHRDSLMASLDPAPGLEGFLAERVALCAWRSQRVIAYETAVTAIALGASEAPTSPPNEAGAMHPDEEAVFQTRSRRPSDNSSTRERASRFTRPRADGWPSSGTSRTMRLCPAKTSGTSLTH